MIRIFLVGISVFSLAALLQLWPQGAAAQTPDLARIYQQAVEAINRGDVNGALALMTDDVQLQGTPGCLAAPCRGKTAVRQDLEQDVVAHLQIQSLGSVLVSGNTVKASSAHRADLLRGTGISRIIINETATFQGDKISRLVFEPESTDPQTAALVRLLTAGPPPAAPSQPSPVRPPSTGDAGLMRLALEAE